MERGGRVKGKHKELNQRVQRCKELRSVAQKMKTQKDLAVSSAAILIQPALTGIFLSLVAGKGQAVQDSWKRFHTSDVQMDERTEEMTLLTDAQPAIITCLVCNKYTPYIVTLIHQLWMQYVIGQYR